MMKKLLTGIVLMIAGLPFMANAQFTVPQGGTGLTSVPNGQCLMGSSNSLRLTYGACGSGGGSGGGTWSTTTSNVGGELNNYSNNFTDIVNIGGSATTTSKFYFDPNLPRAFFTGNLGLGTTTPSNILSVVGSEYLTGDLRVANITATGTLTVSGNTSLQAATSTNFAITNTTNTVLKTAVNGAVVPAVNGTDYTLISAITCTNQFIRSITAAGAGTCNTVQNADLANSTISGVALGSNLASLTATNATLTFSGSYNGSAAQTVGLNLGNANVWTASTTFQQQTNMAQASTSMLTVAGNTYLGSLNGVLKGTNGLVGVASNGTDYTLITANTCSAGQHFNQATAAGVFTCAADSGGGTGNVSTSTVPTRGNLAYWTTSGATPELLGSVATTSVSCSGNISCTSFNALGSASTISFTGTLPVANGGTGQTAFSQGWLGVNNTGTIISSTSPTVAYITATSTVATSTFYRAQFLDFASTSQLSVSGNSTTTFTAGMNISTGCYAVRNTCLANGSGGSGTVTSVDMSVPTGLTISGNPITSAGTLALGLASGFTIPVQNNLISTSSVLTSGQVLYATGANTVASVSTSSETCTAPVSCSSFNVVGSGGAVSLSTVGVANGGTGATTYGQGWISSPGGTSALTSSTSPTFNYFTATSTGQATSTIYGGLSIGDRWRGQVSSTTRVEFVSNGSQSDWVFDVYSGFGVVHFGSSGGTPDARTVLSFTNRDSSFIRAGSNAVGQLIGKTWDGGTFDPTGSIDFKLDGTPSGGNTPGSIGLFTTPAGSTTPNLRMTIRNDGKIGIGTSTPAWMMQIATNSPSLALSENTGATNLKHWLFNTSGGVLYIGTSTDNYATSSPMALTVTNGGNLGISSSSPGSFLSIASSNGINFTQGTSTFSSTGGINLKNGCFSINGTCVTGGGGGGSGTVTSITAGTNITITEGSPCTTSCTINSTGGISGGFGGLLAAWTNGTTLQATSTPVFSSFVSTSTSATSTMQGPLVMATSSIITQQLVWGYTGSANASCNLSTSTTMTVPWHCSNDQSIGIGTSAVTINFADCMPGGTYTLSITNPKSGTAGTVTFGSGIIFPGQVVVGQTTTAGSEDKWVFKGDVGTSTALTGITTCYFMFVGQDASY